MVRTNVIRATSAAGRKGPPTDLRVIGSFFKGFPKAKYLEGCGMCRMRAFKTKGCLRQLVSSWRDTQTRTTLQHCHGPSLPAFRLHRPPVMSETVCTRVRDEPKPRRALKGVSGSHQSTRNSGDRFGKAIPVSRDERQRKVTPPKMAKAAAWQLARLRWRKASKWSCAFLHTCEKRLQGNRTKNLVRSCLGEIREFRPQVFSIWTFRVCATVLSSQCSQNLCILFPGVLRACVLWGPAGTLVYNRE